MNSTSWQHPFVNIFKHFDITSSKKCVKQGDVAPIMDRDIKSTVYRIRGLVPANNYIQFPSSHSTNQNLSLTGRLFYVLFRPIFDKYFCVHIDVLTHEQHVVRISLSNLYREFKVSQTSIQFPYMTTGTDIHWSVLCLDLHTILLTYLTNEHYHMIKSFQLCGNLFVKNCFTSQFLYEPGVDNDTAKRTGLLRAGIRSLPRELSYPIDKGESWHDRYDFIMFPNSSSTMGKNTNEPFDKVGNVRLPTPRKLDGPEDDRLDTDEDEMPPLTAQTALVNGQLKRSITDFAHITQRSATPTDHQLHWRAYHNPVDHFATLPNTQDSPAPAQDRNDGVHLYVQPPKLPTASSVTDDSNYDLALTTDRLDAPHLRKLLPDPIIRLRTAIGLGEGVSDLLWTSDSNYVLYPSNAVVVQMHVETQQQWFFVGHTDKITALAYNNHTSLLATVQTGPSAIIRLWKFETRRCIHASRVPNACDLYALDYANHQSSSALVVVGHDERSRTVVCLYNTNNASKGSIELLSRATADVSITHIRFIPNDITSCISIGFDNIRFWNVSSGSDFKSVNVPISHHDRFEYTDLQFDNFTNHRVHEVIVYIATKSGHVLELLCNERQVIQTHSLSDRLRAKQGATFSICKLVCTNQFRITGSDDGYVRVWSTDFSQVYIEAKYDQAIRGLAFSPDQIRVVTCTASGSFSVLNLATKAHLSLTRTHTKCITDIDYDDAKKRLLSVGQDGTIRLWCFRTGKQLSEFTSEYEIPVVVAYAPDRQTFACGFSNGTIKVFDLNTSVITDEVTHHNVSVTGVVYARNGLSLISCDAEGDLCLSDANNRYRLHKAIGKALIPSGNGPMPLSMSSDGKCVAYVGPTEFIVTIVESNSLNQLLRIDISSCTFTTSDQRTITSAESGLFARFAAQRQLFVATANCKLLRFDSYTGRLLSIIEDVHKQSIDSLTVSSDGQYLVTSGDRMLKFWNANMELDVNSQNFAGHSDRVRKILFTDDDMHVISVGDSILIWDVLAWRNAPLSMPHDAQCIVPPQAVMEKVLEHTAARPKTSRPGILRKPLQSTEPTAELDYTVVVTQGEKRMNRKQLLTKSSQEQNLYAPSSIRRHFVQRTTHSQLAKKRYLPAKNEETLKLQSIVGYNGNGRENLVWHPSSGFFAYTVGCTIIVENLNTNQQTFLTGHTEEISTLALSNDATMLASAQCAIPSKGHESLAKIIVWDVRKSRQHCSIYQTVQAVQCMAFSKDDRYLVTIGNHQKPLVTLWSTKDYSHLLNWEDDFSSSCIHCLAWNPLRPNEFCLGGSQSTIRVCTISEPTDEMDISLQVVNGTVPIILNGSTTKSCEVTACNYLASTVNLVLCATNTGFVTCWNSRLCLCVLHWKADTAEISYVATIRHKLITGSATGCLKLWNIENIEMNLGSTNMANTNYGLTIIDEFQLDDAIVSAAFDDAFDMGIVGTNCSSLWYICWTTDRSKTRLATSHADQITGLVPLDDTHLVTSSLDGTIRVFQLDDRNEILRFHINGLKVTCLAPWEHSSIPNPKSSQSSALTKGIRPSIRAIVAGYDDGTLRTFHLIHEQMIAKLQAHSSMITAIHVPVHSTISLSGATDGSVAISDLVQGQLLRVVNEHRGPAPICTIDSRKSTENNAFVWLIASHDRRVSLWRSTLQFDGCSLLDWLTFSAPDSTDEWHSLPPSLARFIDANTVVYTGYGVDKCLQIYHLDTRQLVRTMSVNQWCSSFDLSTAKLAPHFIALGTKGRLVQLKDYTQETFQDYIGHSEAISNVKFSRSNNLLITTSSNEIFVWRVVLH